jgi:hypothetical protein
VLKIDVPRLSEQQGSQLDERLLDLWPDLVAYAISFVVIGRYWFVHHRFFAVLARGDGRLVALNIGFLAFLVLIPFASDVVGDYSDEKPAPITYAAVLTATGLVNWLIVRHALRQNPRTGGAPRRHRPLRRRRRARATGRLRPAHPGRVRERARRRGGLSLDRRRPPPLVGAPAQLIEHVERGERPPERRDDIDTRRPLARLRVQLPRDP